MKIIQKTPFTYWLPARLPMLVVLSWSFIYSYISLKIPSNSKPHNYTLLRPGTLHVGIQHKKTLSSISKYHAQTLESPFCWGSFCFELLALLRCDYKNRYLVVRAGLEPATSRASICHSTQLSYRTV